MELNLFTSSTESTTATTLLFAATATTNNNNNNKNNKKGSFANFYLQLWELEETKFFRLDLWEVAVYQNKLGLKKQNKIKLKQKQKKLKIKPKTTKKV